MTRHRRLGGAAAALLLFALRAPATAAAAATTAADWRLPAIDWSRGSAFSIAAANYSLRAFDIVQWPGDSRFYLYSDLVLLSNPECPASFGGEIGAFAAPGIMGPWTFAGVVAHRNTSLADAGGLATPTAVVRASDNAVLLYFAYEGLPVGGGLRGIGGAMAMHPLGPFTRLATPVAEAPAGWHRPRGPGGIFDDPEVVFFSGRFHLFHSRKHLNDLNCTVGAGGPRREHCIEWRTSLDGETWTRQGVLSAAPASGPAMDETMSARVYVSGSEQQLVLLTDGDGMVAFTTPAAGLLTNNASAMAWTPGAPISYAGLNASFVGVALRVLPIVGAPTHVALGWKGDASTDGCGGSGGITFAVFALL